MATKTKITKIGNSKGVRIPKALLEQSNLKGEVELEAQPGKITIRAKRKPREGWEKQIKQVIKDYGLEEPELDAWRNADLGTEQHLD